MIKRNIFLLVLFIFNINNSFYINGGCCNSCRGRGTSKGEINNNTQSKQKNKNIIPNGNPLSKIIPGNFIPIPNDQYPGNPTLNNNPYNAQQNNPNNNIQEPKNETVMQGVKGLKNVGASCYMNATLQCFSNCPSFRKKLLGQYEELKQNKDKYKLSLALAEVLDNLWSNNGEKHYSPNNFKETIEEMKPLLNDIAAKDPKDLVLFIIQKIHEELKNPNPNIKINDNYNAYNFTQTYTVAKNERGNKGNSVISEEFYFYYNTMTTCCNCNTTINNVQSNNTLYFPLEEVRKFKGYNSNNSISIKDCFEYDQREQTPNEYYCNHCKQLTKGKNKTQIVSAPKTLIINLRQWKEIENKVGFVLDERMEIENFIRLDDSPHYYELIGVISDFGSNDYNNNIIAYCRNSENCNWYRFNNQDVNECTFEDVKKNNGPHHVLFYSYVQV